MKFEIENHLKNPKRGPVSLFDLSERIQRRFPHIAGDELALEEIIDNAREVARELLEG